MSKSLDYYLSLQYDINLQVIPDEDGGGWLAKIDELEGCISDGETPDEAVNNIQDAKKEWIEFCIGEGLSIPEPQKDTLEYSGRFTLRVGKSVHRKLVGTAKQEGISINNLVNNYVVRGLENTSMTNTVTEILRDKLQPKINISINSNNKRSSKSIMHLEDPHDYWNVRTQSNNVLAFAQQQPLRGGIVN